MGDVGRWKRCASTHSMARTGASALMRRRRGVRDRRRRPLPPTPPPGGARNFATWTWGIWWLRVRSPPAPVRSANPQPQDPRVSARFENPQPPDPDLPHPGRAAATRRRDERAKRGNSRPPDARTSRWPNHDTINIQSACRPSPPPRRQVHHPKSELDRARGRPLRQLGRHRRRHRARRRGRPEPRRPLRPLGGRS